MRLSLSEQTAIKTALASIDEQAKVYLFGSRVDNTKKGGDIDLLVISDKMDWKQKSAFKTKLWDAIGEQKIDIVIPDESNKAFVDLIMDDAILL
jgi:predicted nucleotidyltransferase